MSDNLYQVVTIVIFIMCVIVNFAFKEAAETAIIDDSLFKTFGQYISTMTFKYSNPIIIVQSVMYLSFFGTLNLKSKFINYISRLTLGVYFIHDNDYVRATIYKFLKGIKDRERIKKEIQEVTYSHLLKGSNLHLVTHPLPAGEKEGEIESLFDESTLQVKLGGKSFNPNEKTFDKTQHYGKDIFSKYIISNYDNWIWFL